MEIVLFQRYLEIQKERATRHLMIVRIVSRTSRWQGIPQLNIRFCGTGFYQSYSIIYFSVLRIVVINFMKIYSNFMDLPQNECEVILLNNIVSAIHTYKQETISNKIENTPELDKIIAEISIQVLFACSTVCRLQLSSFSYSN